MTSEWVSESFIQAIYCSITKQWLSMNESLNHLIKLTICSTTLIHSVIQTSDCHYERVSDSVIQMICSVMLIYSVTKQVTGDMNESLNHPFKLFILKHWFTESFETTKLLYVALVATVLCNKVDLHMKIWGSSVKPGSHCSIFGHDLVVWVKFWKS